MKGNDIFFLRDSMALSIQDLADCLGKHSNTVVRWGALGDGDLKLHPNVDAVLITLIERARAETPEVLVAFGLRIKHALTNDGRLKAQAMLLNFALSPKPETGSASTLPPNTQDIPA